MITHPIKDKKATTEEVAEVAELSPQEVYIAEHATDILAAQQAADEADRVLAEAEETLKQAKDAAKGAEAHWKRAYRELKEAGQYDPQGSLSFGESEADKDVWRELPVADLGLSETIIEKLGDMNLTTLGKLTDYSNAGNDYADIRGITEKRAGNIEDAWATFWKEHPEFCKPEPEPDEDPEEQEAKE